MHTLPRLAAAAILLVTAGCTSTPDLSAWSSASTDVANAVSAENRAVIDRVDSAIAEINLGIAADWNIAPTTLDSWKTTRASWKNSNETVDAAMAAMVAYAQALANLAAAGETGKDSIRKMTESITAIANTLGQTFPIAGPVVNFMTFLGGEWNRAQAQDSLADAMTQTQPHLLRLQMLLNEAANVQRPFINRVASLERQLARKEAGIRIMNRYKRERDSLRAAIASGPAGASGTAAQVTLLNEMETRLRIREAKINAASIWAEGRKAALDQILKAATAWRDTHAEAAKLLTTCGGFRALKPACGTLTAANLKVVAGYLQAILDRGKKQAAGP
jgi:hypothetical protein